MANLKLVDAFTDFVEESTLPYRQMMTYYNCALMEVETKFKVLNEQFSLFYDRNPIESIHTRIKSQSSILKKLQKKNLALTIPNIENNLFDIAGVRVICSFTEDIYSLANSFLSQDDVRLIEKKDYIQADKYVSKAIMIQGQDAVNVAKEFNEKVGVDGIIITKMDGDTRGGAALSIRSVTGKPILYVGMGEKLEDLQQFYPDRMTSRILGMGDVLSLIEKAEQTINEEDALRMTEKMKKAEFDFNDFLAKGKTAPRIMAMMAGLIP